MNNKQFKCPICGKTTFNEYPPDEICKYCGWQHDIDPYSNDMSELLLVGANDISIFAFKMRYRLYLNLNSKYHWMANQYPKLTKNDDLEWKHTSKKNDNFVAEKFSDNSISIKLEKDNKRYLINCNLNDEFKLSLKVKDKELASLIYDALKDELYICRFCEDKKLKHIFYQEIKDRYKPYKN